MSGLHPLALIASTSSKRPLPADLYANRVAFWGR